MARPVAIFAALMLGLTACSSLGIGEADKASPTTALDLTSQTTTSVATADYDTYGAGPDELAFLDRTTTSTAPTDNSSASPADGGGTPTPRNGGPGTVTPVSEDGIPLQYTGVLGYLTVDDVLAESAGPLPVGVPGMSPLTGLPGNSGPATVVKIDNSSKARPQMGLNAADVVIEEQVEWGITRLAAVFQTNDTNVGPVRSGRSTDISILASLGEPALVYSGANDVIDILLLRMANVRNYSAARSGGYWRERTRRAPSNLFADTSSFAGGAGPAPMFDFDTTGAPEAGTPTTTVNVTYPNNRVEWRWDNGQWLRWQNGTAHTTDGGAQVSAANVIIAEVEEVGTGMTDSAGSPVPEYVFAGEGRAVAFVDGVRIDGRWTRARLREPAVFVSDAGEVIQFTPGRTWIELVVPGTHSSS